MKKYIGLILKRAAVLLVAAVLALAAISPYADAEDDGSVTTIRLGYFNFQTYMLGAEEDAPKSGFVYDLLCDVASINNWKYEFVYGDFNMLYEQLLNGEIDILPCLVYTDERAQNHLFSDEEIYTENYFVSVPKGAYRDDIQISDLDGKKISSVSDCYQNDVFMQWAAENGISMELVCTPSFDDSWDQVRNGETDFILNIDSAAQDSGCVSVFKVGSGSSRFAIAPGRDDIRMALNRAIVTIYEINPFSISHLKEKYLSSMLSSYKLSEKEEAWLAGKDAVTIAGFKNNRPYTYAAADGSVTGIYPDMVNGMFEKLDIDTEVKWILYDSETEMMDALSSGTVDLICPYYYSHYLAETNDMIISEMIQDVNVGLLRGDNSRETVIRRIAVPDTVLNIQYAKDNYPGTEILRYPSVDKCVEAVEKGTADAALAHVTVLQLAEEESFKKFSVKTLLNACPVCFASGRENGELICIINRGLHLVTDAELQALDIEHQPQTVYSLWNYVKNNKLLAGTILIALVLLIMFAVSRHFASQKMKKSLAEITKQKEIIEANEKELIIAKEAANSASNAKSAFLFNMSHDIRTPMNAILGYSDRMLRHIDDKVIVKDSAGKIKSSGEYLLSLINDVLDMARIESDKVKLEENVYDICERTQKLCDVFEVDMQKKGLTFEIDFSGVRDPVVRYDSLKMKQIMLNLISNSVKYTPSGGTVTHTMRQTESDKPGYGRYVVTVKDNGIGMSKEFVSHIFEQFSRSDDSITKETQGTGLGMSIVGKLVDLMGGTIEIDSEPGKGTEITMVFDLKIASAEEIERVRDVGGTELNADKLKGVKVLLVDDNELNREIAHDVLEEAGIVVADTAVNGVEALGKVKQSAPGDFNIVLMDVQMPVMDGYEATRQIRALDDKRLACIPIIAMTANAFEEDRQQALKAGMNEHVAKPINIPKLFEVMAKFI